MSRVPGQKRYSTCHSLPPTDPEKDWVPRGLSEAQALGLRSQLAIGHPGPSLSLSLSSHLQNGAINNIHPVSHVAGLNEVKNVKGSAQSLADSEAQ